ncbi:MAG: alpha/beta hydrolase [Pseudomonadota bacterium]
MNTKKVFIHGVPDCPKIWNPLIEQLGLSAADYIAPSLPGFESAPPAGFDRTKDAYADFLVKEIEAVCREAGPIDLIAHDWGAILALRIAGLRSDLVRTWAVSNAVYAPKRTGHPAARAWAVPILGEFVMMLASPRRIKATLIRAKMPPEMVEASVELWRRRHIKKSIIGLYRSANGLNWIGSPWVDTLETLPKRGVVFWGVNDPFAPLELGRSWAENYGFPFVPIDDAGHWAIAEKPEAFSPTLVQLWQSADAQTT